MGPCSICVIQCWTKENHRDNFCDEILRDKQPLDISSPTKEFRTPHAHQLTGRSPQPVPVSQEPPLTRISRAELQFVALPGALASAKLRPRRRLRVILCCCSLSGQGSGVYVGEQRCRAPLADLSLNPQQLYLPDGVCILTLFTLSHRAMT